MSISTNSSHSTLLEFHSRYAFVSIHVAFLESLVVKHATSLKFIEIATVRFTRYQSSFSYPLLEPAPDSRLKRILILIPIPRLYLTASTNQSPSCNWKRQQLVRLEDSRLNCCRNTIYDGAGGWWKEKGSYLGAPRHAGVTLIFLGREKIC